MQTLNMNKKSLDLGCNNRPRNPYHCQELYGVDLDFHDIENVVYRQANLALEPIPFDDNYFDYVSAFDFIEHIPRILPKDNRTRLPFIELMNEIWRVLKPNGVFYAVTPAYPSSSAFQDPTHVNIITEKTHEYFCGEEAAGKMYGFNGQFEILRAEFVIAKKAFTAEKSTAKFLYNLKYRLINPRRLTHFLWELQAQK
ncbi:MAG: class I SAM-dependent methyltransferase [Syntrophales bacterium]|uniref:class I SAM-dependent methyltransferase n=1 Tax=Candidatus Wunengus sp. YC61 TaxID=3367698 RepID=UPI0027194868|nr:class I SAM-dependent methyltransferase [Syntrophales bacterium]